MIFYNVTWYSQIFRTIFALLCRIDPKVTKLEISGRLEIALAIAEAGFLKWKANHHDDQPGGG